MSRKRKPLDAAQLKELETLASVLSQDQAAAYLGMCRRNLQKILEQHAEAREAWDRGKAKAIAAVAQGLLQKALKGNLNAMIFFLKTQGRWSEVSRLEHSGADGEPLPSGAPSVILVTAPQHPVPLPVPDEADDEATEAASAH